VVLVLLLLLVMLLLLLLCWVFAHCFRSRPPRWVPSASLRA
jgi:hypothetical protein